ncbi:MAG: lactonase family protein [Roseibium sp.]
MSLHMYVGSCNVPTPYFGSANGDGVSVYRFEAKTGSAKLINRYEGIDNPTYLSVTSDGRRIFANTELFGRAQGLVTELAFDPGSGTITHTDMVASRGSITSHNSIAENGRYLLVTNYAQGHEGPDQSVAVFPISQMDGIRPACSSAAHEGSSVNPDRQARSHAHFIRQLPDGHLVVADLGLDKLMFYRLSEEGSLDRILEMDLPAGTGPRHLSWTKNGKSLFVVGELNSTVSSLSLENPDKPVLLGTIPTIPDSDEKGNHCSDIQISPDDRFIYVGNRGHDSITVFGAGNDGQLVHVQNISSGGATPRSLALTPCGRWLLSANQDSDHIAVFARDLPTGTLIPGPGPIELGTPMCIKFAHLKE